MPQQIQSQSQLIASYNPVTTSDNFRGFALIIDRYQQFMSFMIIPLEGMMCPLMSQLHNMGEFERWAKITEYEQNGL